MSCCRLKVEFFGKYNELCGKLIPFSVLSKETVGEPFYLLVTTLNQKINKGPVDVITCKALYTLNEDWLLWQVPEFSTVVCSKQRFPSKLGNKFSREFERLCVYGGMFGFFFFTTKLNQELWMWLSCEVRVLHVVDLDFILQHHQNKQKQMNKNHSYCRRYYRFS